MGREKERVLSAQTDDDDDDDDDIYCFGLVNLFNGISTSNGLFNAEIWFIQILK